ncbi:MAG: hypothetical protein HC804_00125 [Anaerolineae bacterium]|nr:hypothetical protein [Anaerolineae bacterium]
MSYDTAAVAAAIVDVLEGLTGMGAAQIGAPESIGPRVGSYVTMGSQQVIRKATGITQRESRFFVMMAYRVDGAEATAETVLMGLVDAFFQAVQDDLTLAGTVHSTEISSQAADEPEYQLRAGKEHREYPIVLIVIQRSSYAVNP